VEELLSYELLDQPLRRWLTATVVALLAGLGLRVVKAILRKRVEPLVERSNTRFDDAILDTIEDTRWWLYIAFAGWAFTYFVTLPENVDRVVSLVVRSIVLIQVGVWGHGLVRRVATSWAHDPNLAEDEQEPDAARKQTVAAAVSFVTRIVVWSTVLVVLLANVGVEVSGLLAGLGIGGVAAALAVQNVLGDLISSLSIYFDRPFDIGDFIIVGSDMGTVNRIGMRSTRLTALGGEQLIFSNSDLAKSRIRNFRRMNERRIVTQIGVTYDTPYETLRGLPDALREIVEGTEGTRFDRAHFKGFGDSALELELVWWVLSPDYAEYMDRQQKILLGVHEALTQRDVVVAFPTRTLHLHTDEPLATEVIQQKSA